MISALWFWVRLEFGDEEKRRQRRCSKRRSNKINLNCHSGVFDLIGIFVQIREKQGLEES